MSRRGDAKDKALQKTDDAIETSSTGAPVVVQPVPQLPQQVAFSIASELHVGALPPPQQLAAYASVGPEVIPWILKTATSETEHRHKIEQEQSNRATIITNSRRWRVRWGLAAGVGTMIVGLVAFVLAVKFQAPGLAYFGLMPGVVAMVLGFARSDAPPPSVPQQTAPPSSPPARETPSK